MFERFGEFGSAAEINLTASGLKEEGDIESLRVLAEENGIDAYDAEAYVESYAPELCDTFTAAQGKIAVEEADIKPQEIMRDWIEYVKTIAYESSDVARAVRDKDHSLRGCMAEILKWSFKNMSDVDAEIKKQAGVTQNVKLGIPGMRTAKKIIREYYAGGADNETISES